MSGGVVGNRRIAWLTSAAMEWYHMLRHHCNKTKQELVLVFNKKQDLKICFSQHVELRTEQFIETLYGSIKLSFQIFRLTRLSYIQGAPIWCSHNYYLPYYKSWLNGKNFRKFCFESTGFCRREFVQNLVLIFGSVFSECKITVCEIIL